MVPAVDLNAYRAEAQAFVSEIDREYYVHFSGQKESFEIEPIYERHAGLFEREAVDTLRGAGNRELLEFAAEGLIGRELREIEAELARREAALEIEIDGERTPFRQAPVEQANEPDPDRRAAIEAARLEATESDLNPLMREALERSHELAVELGWPSMRSMCEDLSGIDLGELGKQTAAFLDASERDYEPLVGPRLEEQLGFGFERLRRSDLPAFFRAPGLDPLFPDERLVGSLRETLGGLGIELESQPNVRVDAEARPTKSPRAFCSPVVVPDEVYLVIAPSGGRDDYEALYHETGHAEHYAHVDAGLPFEQRHLGDNSITESFAFLFQYLTADPEWLRRRLGADDPEPVEAQARAGKLVFLRRYAAKLQYELELHDAPERLDDLRDVYARTLGDAVHVDWPATTWLSDVDPFFYAARYLRAWAMETDLRRTLRERFGVAWFEEPEAGALLRQLWARGQSDAAAAPDFAALLDDLALVG
jgi:hypothetical protein